MSKQIPVFVDQAVRKHRASEASRKRNEILSQCAEKVRGVCTELAGSHIPSIMPIHGADIIFSIMVPAVGITTGVLEEKAKIKAKGLFPFLLIVDHIKIFSTARNQEAISHNQLISQLKAAELGMSDLLQNTTSFATWWTMADNHLKLLENRIQKGAASINDIQLHQVKSSWDRVHNLYDEYLLEVCILTTTE